LSTNPYLAAESCSLFPLEKSLFVKDIPLLISAGISLGAAAAQGRRCLCVPKTQTRTLVMVKPAEDRM
jgi:hypothetical protein